MEINKSEIKAIGIRPMLGFKSFTSAASTTAGIEIVNMIRKGQFRPKLRPFQQFCQLAA